MRLLVIAALIPVMSGCGLGLCVGACAATNAIGPATGSFDFGTRTLGGSYTESFTLTNRSQADIESISVTSLSEPFGFVGGNYPGTGGTCGDSLQSGASCTVRIRYTAGAPVGTNRAEMTLTYPLDGDVVSSAISLLAVSDNGSLNRSLGADGRIRTLVPTQDGVWVGGQFSRYSTRSAVGLAFLGLDGEISPQVFPPALNGSAYHLAQANDGSNDVYVVGTFTTAGGSASSMVVRVNSDGSVDGAFSVGSGFTGTATLAVAPLADGDVYVGGIFSSYQGTSRQNVIRLNSNGSADLAFNAGAWISDEVDVIAPFPDGSGDLLVGGTYTAYLGYDYLVRLNSDGSVDPALPTGFDNYVRSLVFLPGGSQFYVGGDFSTFGATPNAGVTRLSPAGVVDPSFTSPLDPGSSVSSVALLSDASGDLLISGNLNIGAATYQMLKLNSDGSLDLGFQRADDLGAPGQLIDAVAAVGDGSDDLWVVGEFSSFENEGSNSIARIHSDGSPLALAVGSGFAAAALSACLPESSGKVYLSGNFQEYDGFESNGLIRLNTDGSVDPTFVTGAGFGGYASAILKDGQGNLTFVGPFFSYQGTAFGGIVRMRPSGEVDPAFAAQNFTGGGAIAATLAADGSDDLYVGGAFTAYGGTARAFIARLNSNGTLDPAFSGTGPSATVRAVEPALDGSGDIYVGGDFTLLNGTGSARIARMNSDGSKDVSFAEGSGFLGGSVQAIKAVPDGSGDIYVGGAFVTYQGSSAVRIVRLNSDGSVDTGFSSGIGPNSTVNAVALAQDGTTDVFVGGQFSTYQGQAYGGVIRLNGDGSPDASWLLGAAPATVLVSPAVDGSGELYIGPNFRFISNRVVDYFARLTSSGGYD